MRTSLQTRAAVLAAGAGVGLAFVASTKHLNCWTFIAGGLSVLAAVIGVVAIEIVNAVGRQIQMGTLWHSAIQKDRPADDAVDAYSAEWHLVENEIKQHVGEGQFQQTNPDTKKKNNKPYRGDIVGFTRQRWLVTSGYAMLALSWISAFISLCIK